jgi:hypothetical protein
MTKLLTVTAFVSFKDQILKVEKLGGMDDSFIFFNPDEKEGRSDWKIQLVEKVFLRIQNEEKLITLDEMKLDFVITNSSGDEIGNSNDLNPEFVDLIVAAENNSPLYPV